MRLFPFTLFVFIAILCIQCTPKDEASIVIYGKVTTVNPNFDMAEAVALKNERIVYVGPKTGADAFIGKNTHVIDTHGYLGIAHIVV